MTKPQDPSRFHTMDDEAKSFIAQIVGHPVAGPQDIAPHEIDHLCWALNDAKNQIIKLSQDRLEALAGVKNPTSDEIAYGDSRRM